MSKKELAECFDDVKSIGNQLDSLPHYYSIEITQSIHVPSFHFKNM